MTKLEQIEQLANDIYSMSQDNEIIRLADRILDLLEEIETERKIEERLKNERSN